MTFSKRVFSRGWVSAALMGLFVLVAVLSLPWSIAWMNVQQLDDAVRHAPAFSPVLSPERLVGDGGSSAATRTLAAMTSWMGHDDLGRSVLFRLLPGFLVSLGIGVAAAAIAVIVGVLYGATAGLAGGLVDRTMMRLVDVLYSLPYVLTVVLLKVALTRPLTSLLGGESAIANLVILLIAISGVSWLTMARVVRGQVLSLRQRPFVEASRAAGAGNARILRRHIIPNLIGTIVAYAALVVPQAIMQEAFLSFLGIGVAPPTPSLGRLATDGVEAVNMFVGYWWLIVFPCGVLVLTLITLNFVGDVVRDTMDRRTAKG